MEASSDLGSAIQTLTLTHRSNADDKADPRSVHSSSAVLNGTSLF